MALPRRTAAGRFSSRGHFISAGGHLRRLPSHRTPPLSSQARARGLDALGFMHEGLSLKRAAREAGTSPSTVLRVGRKEGALRKEGGEWTLRSTPGATFHRVHLGEDGAWHQVSVFGLRDADLLRAYETAILNRDFAKIRTFRGKTFRDSQGREHEFQTSRRFLGDLDRAGELEPPPVKYPRR